MNKKIKLMIAAAIFTITSMAQQKQMGMDTIVNLDHVALSVGNLDKMEAWYKTCFNMREIQHLEIESMQVRTVLLQAPNGFKVELIELKNSTREQRFTDPLNAASVQGYGHMALIVKDLHTVFNELINNGALQVIPPSPAVKKGDTYAYVKDLEGNLIELIQGGQRL